MKKPCSKCKKVKPLTEFNKNRNLRLGVQSQCRECTRQWRPSSEESILKNKERLRKWNRFKGSGFTQEDYDNKLKEQNGKCAICKTLKEENRDLCADHNHDTGQKRGLLCHKCNTGIGLLQDNVDVLCSAIEYLEYYKNKTK